ncbi:MAG: N-acetylmuramic acid 6-phosphate etherase [Candidatus Zixiibacteriota bacterium]|nr:MAG: N-acetylmuramic acid 6-phosphate etherase [candidate division Zixibacteria bacterium]
MSRQVFEEIKDLTTEAIHPRAGELDRMTVGEILQFMAEEDAKVAPAVRAVLPQVEQAVDRVLRSFAAGGRLIYIGAGTSGRLGILDAAECPPTFGSPPEQVTGVIAGGRESVFRAQEGAEDRQEQGGRDLEALGLADRDTVVGITASRRTPYVLGALEYARSVGAATVLLICNLPDPAAAGQAADVVIAPVLGPEVVMGSTRLKAGTATKIILNLITTAAFVRQGKVYRGMMVDLRAGSQKLQARSRRVLMLATGLDFDQADELLARAGGQLKTAIVMALCGVEADPAREMLERAGGFVRGAVGK